MQMAVTAGLHSVLTQDLGALTWCFTSLQVSPPVYELCDVKAGLRTFSSVSGVQH